ncbi:hypothetical protein KEM60_03293 [Austwickia sp. TVS 96-490-7B]|nr:hypothetical protein [Austwickia sp. TVS 96-490-7B]
MAVAPPGDVGSHVGAVVEVVFAGDGFESVWGAFPGQVFAVSEPHSGEVRVGGVDTNVWKADPDAAAG